MKEILEQYSKEHNVDILFASVIGSSIYTDREPNDVDIFVVYDKKETTILDSFGSVEHHRYGNIDVTAVTLGKYISLIKYGSFFPYDAMFKGNILIDNSEFKQLIQDYFEPKVLAKVYMKMFESEFDLHYLNSPKDYSRVLQYLINIHWLLKEKYAPIKLINGCTDSLRVISSDVLNFSKGYTDKLSDTAMKHIQEIKEQQLKEIEDISGSVLDKNYIILNYIRSKLNAIL